MKTRLIVNADDYGRTPGVSTGIQEAHRRGIVTSTTAMMNMPGVEEALCQARGRCPRLGLGVHLVLTAGAPLLPAAQVGSLTGGTSLFRHVDELIPFLPTLEFDEILVEWRAQVEKFVAVTGRAPDHLDSHHHVSYLALPLFRAMLELSREYRCAIRLPVGEAVAESEGDPAYALAQQTMLAGRPLLEELRPRHPDRLNTSFYGPSASLEHLLNLLSHLPPGTTELMSHPGHADAALLQGSSYNRQREIELAALTDARVRTQAGERGIELITFAQL